MTAPEVGSWNALYQFRHRYHDRGGLRYHYIDEGVGDPVVMVHGNPTWSFYFRTLINALKANHRCIAPDHIGCGLSDKPDDSRYAYTLQNRVDDLESLLDFLGFSSRVTLVLHDWGGMIGMATALRRPERIARFVLLNTAAFMLPPGRRLPRRLKILRGRHPLASVLVRGFNAFAWGATYMATTKGLPDAVREGLLAPYDSWANRIATLRFVQDIPLKPGDTSYELAKSVDDNLHTLADRPALICWGERDFVFNDDFLREWRRRFPDAEVHAFADAGHYILEDAPERVVPLVQAFLRDNPIAQAPPPNDAVSTTEGPI